MDNDKPKKKTKAERNDKRASVWPIQTSEAKDAEADELKKTGRPHQCTPELIQKVQALIRNGNYIETACGVVGISKVTMHNWFKRGNAGEKPFVDFLNAVNKASFEAEALDLAIISQAAAGNDAAGRAPQWTAAAWKLERRNNVRWGRKFEASIQGVAGGPAIKMRNETRKSIDRLSSDEIKMLKTLQVKMVADEDAAVDEPLEDTGSNE